MIFLNRTDAGRRIADHLSTIRIPDPVVMVMQLGGIRIAWEIAQRIQAPMDVLLARDVCIPGPTGIPIGGVAGGAFYPDQAALARQKVSWSYAERLAHAEILLQYNLESSTRGKVPALDVRGRTAVLVSDGWGSRTAVSAAVESLLARECHSVICAAPVCSPELVQRVASKSQVVTLFEPENYRSVMLVYEGYRQTTEDEAAWLIGRSRPFHVVRNRAEKSSEPDVAYSGSNAWASKAITQRGLCHLPGAH